MIDSMRKFRRPGMGERFQQLIYLLKHTLTIVGRDHDILGPPLRMVIYAAVVVSAFFASMIAYGFGAGGKGTLLLLLSLFLFLYKFFYYNRQELMMSWLVFETAAGRDRSQHEARAEVAKLGRQVWMLGFIDMFAAWLAGRQAGAENREGGFIDAAVIGGIGEVWDLANHFLLPAYAVDKLGCREGFGKIKAVKDNVPEALMGVFGIDIMGRVVGTLMMPIHMGGIVLGVLLGLWFGDMLPVAFSAGAIGDLFRHTAYPSWMPFGPQTLFNWLPVILFIGLSKMLGSVSERVVTAVKVIYFTLFYARIMHADELTPEVREELEAYLTFNDRPERSGGATAAAAGGVN